MPLTELEQERYSRPLKLPGFSLEVQEKLKSARVLVIGAGGLGIPVLQYLSSAGVGKLGILDFDRIELSNLHRQILYSNEDLGKYKSEVALEKLGKVNPEVELEEIRTQLDPENAEEIISQYDLVVDGSDNFPTRYLVNDVCVILKKTLVYGSIHQFEGQVSVFNLGDSEGIHSANYRDVLATPPAPELVPNCEEGGVLGSLAGIIGSLMANEVLKLLSGLGEPLSDKLLAYDSSYNDFRVFKIKKDPSNPLNNLKQDFIQSFDYPAFCGLKMKDSIQVKNLHSMMESGEEFQLIDVREVDEYLKDNMNALNLPLSSLHEKIDQINREGKVVLHCKSGARSRRALEELKTKHQFKNLFNLEGGIDAWNRLHQFDEHS